MKSLLSATKVTKRFKVILILIALSTPCLIAGASGSDLAQMDVHGVTNGIQSPNSVGVSPAEDGKTPLASSLDDLVIDPSPPNPKLHIPAPVISGSGTSLSLNSSAMFNIIYEPAGATDPADSTHKRICAAFPDEAKVALNAATQVWGSLINSNVPITINVCWTNLGESLGDTCLPCYEHDFANAPRTHTIYAPTLANALAGGDLHPEYPDMYIIFNSTKPWYYGTDAYTPANKLDLMTVALHEIAHGLNFGGSMGAYKYDNSWKGNWGYTDSDHSDYPDIYDKFACDKDGIGLLIQTFYPKNSTALGSALVSNAIFFWGVNAANAKGYWERVKLYAPWTWEIGSSYNHLDYTIYAGSLDSLMVHSLGKGVSVHSPGPVTMAMLKDLGWSTNPLPCTCHLFHTFDFENTPITGTSQPVQVETTRSDCKWTAQVIRGDSWIRLSTAGGTGYGSVTITVDPITGTGREGVVQIGGWQIRVIQGAKGGKGNPAVNNLLLNNDQ